MMKLSSIEVAGAAKTVSYSMGKELLECLNGDNTYKYPFQRSIYMIEGKYICPECVGIAASLHLSTWDESFDD